jgi:O-antigen/teichoic acid export membrane protein
MTASISDQALNSFPNFIFNILLARWLPSSQYGAFAFGFSIFLFLSGFQSALILEPMSVLGPIHYPNQIYSYLYGLFKLNLAGSAALAIPGLLVSWAIFSQSPLIAEALLGASLSTPCILLFWFARRSCYLCAGPQTAVVGGIVYTVLLAGILLLHRFHPIGVTGAFLWMSFASVAASLVIFGALLRKNNGRPFSGVSIAAFWPAQWQYGKWAVGTTLVYWAANTITVPAIGVLLSLEQSGVFRALQNLILPLQQIGAALGTLFLPWFSKQTQQMDGPDLARPSNRLIIGFVVAGLAYLAGLVLFNKTLIELLYNKPEYISYAWISILLGIYGLLDFISNSFSTLLRAAQRPHSIFWARLWSAVASLTISLYLIQRMGIAGAAYGTILTGGITLAVLAYQYLLLTRQPNSSVQSQE